MDDLKRKIEKPWNQLTEEQRTQAAYILKRKLIYNWLIPSNMEIEQILFFLEKNNPNVVFHFPEGKETVLTLNDNYWKGLAFALQKKHFDGTRRNYHKEYHIDIPELVGLEETFKANIKPK